MDESKTRTLGPRIAVGLGLGGVFLLSLLHPLGFTTLAAVVAAFAVRELRVVLRAAGWHVPTAAPVAAAVVVFATYFYGPVGQWFSLIGSVAVLLIWRVTHIAISKTRTTAKQLLRDLGASGFAQVYVPLLISFAVLIVRGEHGTALVLGLVVTVVMIDTFGYLVGRFFGKTQLIPRISPKKTWEGFLASAVGALLGGLFTSYLVSAELWFGLVFGVAVLISSVLGDLSESLIKRDMKVKDMGDVLPGHGGFMDRIDSLLPSSFVGFALSLWML